MGLAGRADREETVARRLATLAKQLGWDTVTVPMDIKLRLKAGWFHLKYITSLQEGRRVETVAVLDFETTGLLPTFGDRAAEIAIVPVRNGNVVDRFQSLMSAGRRIPSDVTQLTGITNSMIAAAPPVAKVMRDAVKFVGNTPVAAHNASFDKNFWDAELAQLSITSINVFACTMLLSRRLYPNSVNHRLSTLGVWAAEGNENI